jgi:hypothetical protein
MPISPGTSCSGCGGGNAGPGSGGADIGAPAEAPPVYVGGQPAYGLYFDKLAPVSLPLRAGWLAARAFLAAVAHFAGRARSARACRDALDPYAEVPLKLSGPGAAAPLSGHRTGAPSSRPGGRRALAGPVAVVR